MRVLTVDLLVVFDAMSDEIRCTAKSRPDKELLTNEWDEQAAIS